MRWVCPSGGWLFHVHLVLLRRRQYEVADDVRLHFEVHGEGRPLVFLHGGTVDFRANYVAFGWLERHVARRLRVIGPDFRGHGTIDKPRDAASCGAANVAADVTALLDHLGRGGGAPQV
jgi:pimeloyl-ACP methyl ester carboxylesterase